MKMLLLSFTIVSGLVLSGCGSSSSSGGGSASPQAKEECGTRSAQYQNSTFYVCYSMSEENNGNGCTTGKQEFDSHNALCNGLHNDTLNKNCARAGRDEYYNRACP